MIGRFIISEFISDTMVEAYFEANNNIIVRLYLQPLNRLDTSNIEVNDHVFAVVDNVSGLGVVLMNFSHDFDHRFDFDLNINGKLETSGEIKSGGEVTATGISQIEYTLTGHTHAAGTLEASGILVTGETAPAEVI